jgi:hypothetical protein
MMPDEETYSKGMFSLTEWEDVNYCDHYFRVNDKGLTDKEVVDLLYELNNENQRLKLENDGLGYALKNIKQIDVEIDIGDYE